jgi:hypothetical protein
MAVLKGQVQQRAQEEWEEVESAPRFDAQFINLDRGDTIEGWLLGTVVINERRRYVMATLQEDGWGKIILPDHAALMQRLDAVRPLPAKVHLENLGRVIKTAKGQRAFGYRVLRARNATPPPEVAAFVEQFQQQTEELEAAPF